MPVSKQGPRVRTLPPRVQTLQPVSKHHCPPEKNRQARRALATNSAAWRKLRAAKLALNPLCECCERNGCPRCAPSRVRAANEIDHKDGDAGNDSPANHQSMCKPCHSHKTAKENHGFGNPSR